MKGQSNMNIHQALTFNDVLLVPIVSANMDTVTELEMAVALAKLGGLGIIHRFLTIEAQSSMVKEAKKQGLVGAAIGINGLYLERAEALINAGVDVLVLDVAHGHTKYVGDAVKAIKSRWPNTEVVAGNVATFDGAKYLFESGADGIKVGVGPGSTCSTRIITGCGVPQLSAIMDCSHIKVPITGDGGIKNSGDVTKALAAGASCVMLGNLLAGTEEAPGYLVMKAGVRCKVYRGMASVGATVSRKEKEGTPLNETEIDEVVPEGVETSVPYKGSVSDVVTQLLGGLASGMSYCGAVNLDQLREKANFVQITQASWQESLPVGYQ